MTSGPRELAAAALVGVLALWPAACSSDPVSGPVESPPTTTTEATRPTAAPTTAPTTVAAAPSTEPPAGAAVAAPVVVIDPGHNGANASHPAEINALVDIGNGMKACNTTGTATHAGQPEHAFNWDVAQRTAAELRNRGVTVELTRPDDDGVGPCITERAAVANRAGAAAFVSIHADGGPASGRGFHIIMPANTPGLTDDIFVPSGTLGSAIHDAIRSGTDMPPADYIGDRDGFDTRSDLGGLNRADVPAVYVESGNMRNATDAALLTDEAFRGQLAAAIATGIVTFLTRQGVP